MTFTTQVSVAEVVLNSNDQVNSLYTITHKNECVHRLTELCY